jgi:hypothetical protein
MKTLQENIDATLASMTTHVVTGLVDTGEVNAQAILYHEEGYRTLDAKVPGFLTQVRAYVTREKPVAYALITDAEYQSDQRHNQPCVLSSCVLPTGQARVECILYERSGDGVALGDSLPLFLDEEFLAFFDNPIDFAKVNAKALNDALDLITATPAKPYMDFFVFQA